MKHTGISSSQSPPFRFIVIFALIIGSSWLISLATLPASIVALWPAGVALATILLFRHAVLGLFAGSLAGCLLIYEGNAGAAITSLTEDHFFSSLQGPWRIGAILFTLILGSFTVVIEKGGGFESLAKKLLGSKTGNPQRRLETATGVMGGLCFFDGLANSLLLGRITQPLADRVGVARAKMAYLVDSTSSSIACIAFISTWIATQLSLIQQSIDGRGITESAYSLFFSSISHNFYCLFTLVLVNVVIWRRWDIGPMKKAKVSEPATQEADDSPSATICAPIWIALVPILILSVSILSLFYLWDTSPLFPITEEKLTIAFSGKAGPYALTLGSVIGLLTACFLFPRHKKEQLPKAVSQGAASMLSPLLILIMAWTFGSVLGELGTARWLADSIGSSFQVKYFPAAIFITGAAISFITGSSWGTMGLLMPIALPAYLDLAGDNPVLLSAVIGAVFSGAVFGDHCSPFSDTTIVSAFSCGVSAREHVITQLPYAGLAAGVSLVIGYCGMAIGINPITCLVLGSLILVTIGYLSTRRNI